MVGLFAKTVSRFILRCIFYSKNVCARHSRTITRHLHLNGILFHCHKHCQRARAHTHTAFQCGLTKFDHVSHLLAPFVVCLFVMVKPVVGFVSYPIRITNYLPMRVQSLKFERSLLLPSLPKSRSIRFVTGYICHWHHSHSHISIESAHYLPLWLV